MADLNRTYLKNSPYLDFEILGLFRDRRLCSSLNDLNLKSLPSHEPEAEISISDLHMEPSHFSHTANFFELAKLEDEIVRLKEIVNEQNMELNYLRPSFHVTRRKKRNIEISPASPPLRITKIAPAPTEIPEITAEQRVTSLPSTTMSPTLLKRTQTLLKRNVLILGDSHGVGLSEIIKNCLLRKGEDANVLGIVKPNGMLCDVVDRIQFIAKDYSKDDVIIIVAGTNDVGNSDCYQLTVRRAIRKIMSSNLKCRVQVMNLPYRYDKLDVNNDVWMANELIKKLIVNSSNVEYAEVHLQRHHYTKHGLHFSRKGKLRYAEKLAATLCVRVADVRYSTESEVIVSEISCDIVNVAVNNCSFNVLSDRSAVVDAEDSDDSSEDLEAAAEAIDRELEAIGRDYLREMKSYYTARTSTSDSTFVASVPVGSAIPVIMGHGENGARFFPKSRIPRKRWRSLKTSVAA